MQGFLPAQPVVEGSETQDRSIVSHGSLLHVKRQRVAAGQHRQQSSQPVAQFPSIHDHVDGAMLQQELAALKAFRQFFPHGLLDHPRPGEADQRLGFGDIDVAQHRQAGGDPAGGGMVRTEIRDAVFGQRVSTALVLAICISETSASCIRAPPLAAKQMKRDVFVEGEFGRRGRSARRPPNPSNRP
jgi:hypothetical protein